MEPNPLSVLLDADARQVWDMLRDPTCLAQWHGWDSNDLAAEIEHIYRTDVRESEDRLRLDLAMGDRFTLAPQANGTRLTLTRGQASGEWARYDADITEGWTTFLQQLRFALNRQPSAPRRTIYVDGTPVSPGDLWTALGIAPRELPGPGASYALTLSTGAALSGQVWYRTATQLGLTVASYAEHGDGLLVLAVRPPLAGVRESPGAQLIASTYGLADTAYDAIAAQWRGVMETRALGH